MLESYISGSLIHLHDIIQLHQSYRFWHYGITLPSDNPNSLAAYLKLNDEQYTTFMTRLGLLRMMENNGKKSLHVITNEWTSFLIGFGLNDIVYFDRMEVSIVPTDGIDVVMYRGYWLDMGKMDMYNNGSIEFESTDNETTASIAAAENMIHFLDDYKFGQRSKEETTTIIIGVIKESIMEDRKQLEAIVDKVVNNGVVDTNKVTKEEFFGSDEAKQKKAPALT